MRRPEVPETFFNAWLYFVFLFYFQPAAILVQLQRTRIVAAGMSSATEDQPSYAEIAASSPPQVNDDETKSEVTNGSTPEEETPVNDDSGQDNRVTKERSSYVPTKGNPLSDVGRSGTKGNSSKEASTNGAANGSSTSEKSNDATENGKAEGHEDKPIIVRHVEYWDTDKDGVIWPQDTYNGFRKFGWSIPLCLFAVYLINGFLSYPTGSGLLPDPFFRIYTSRLYKDKHGSNSMSIDNEGKFHRETFDEFFAKYDQDNKDGLTLRDVLYALKGQRMAFDIFGWCATFFEWFAMYLLIWPKDGVMRKEDVRGVFDGSLFYKKADEYTKKRSAKQKSA